MTADEAYCFTIEKVSELKDDGIEVLIRPSKSRNDKYLKDKYNKPERISPELWSHIELKAKNSIQVQRIFDMATYLGMCGIRFDTGCGCGSRDWELDWSFEYKPGEDNFEWTNARRDLEDMVGENGLI